MVKPVSKLSMVWTLYTQFLLFMINAAFISAFLINHIESQIFPSLETTTFHLHPSFRRYYVTLGTTSQNMSDYNLHPSTTHDELVEQYLRRIGFSYKEAIYQPSADRLQSLLTAHLLHVPFENMDQHTHPGNARVPTIKRKTKLPSLDVQRSLHKIINQNRGGFCYEVNLSFCWLLRSLGYKARLAVADVGCKQNVPAHVVILVDGLKHGSSEGIDINIPILVDVGFGCPGVCDVILPLTYNGMHNDLNGDKFRFDRKQTSFSLHQGRFDTVLYRTRIDSPSTEEPMYRFHSEDDLDYNTVEFQHGLEYVLTQSPTFNEKRLCVISTESGHITLGSDYVKWVERWETVKQENLSHEEDWRLALLKYFGVKLEDEDED